MIIQLRTVYAGPNGNFDMGQVVDFPEADAKSLIEGGFAFDPSAVKPVEAPATDDEPVGFDITGQPIKKAKAK